MTTTTDMLCRLTINNSFAQVNDQLLSIGVSGSSIVSLAHNCLLHNFIGISYGLDINSLSHHNTWHIVALDKRNPAYCFVIATALKTDRQLNGLKCLIFSSMAIKKLYQAGKSKTHEKNTSSRGGAKGGLGGSTPPDISRKLCQNDYRFFFFCDYNVKISGTCNTPLERCFQDLSDGILQAPKFQKFQLVKLKKICSHLANAGQAGQKNCNGKTTMFSTSALKESRASAYYWQCLLVRIGWSIL
jgi:hypothetical protein